MAHGTTQSRKAKESEDQPETARILQQNRIIEGKITDSCVPIFVNRKDASAQT